MYSKYGKYIKYKTKYNNLKQQIAGASTINILLVSHSSTIRCFLESIISEQMQKYRTDANVAIDAAIDNDTTLSPEQKQAKKEEQYIDKVRFKNSAILLLEIREDKTVFINLVYEGFTAMYKEGNKYFTTPDSLNVSDIPFYHIQVPIEKFNIVIPPLNYNIFIVRHAQADHNVDKHNKLPDTLLTSPKGHNQATQIGIELRKILNETKINYLFASNLKRSRQTIEIILKELNFDPVDIVVLPCMHDIKAGSDGRCFQKDPEKISIAGRMSCNIDTCSNESENDYCCKIGNIIINWVYYKLMKSINCTEKNIIQLIFEYIKYKYEKKRPAKK